MDFYVILGLDRDASASEIKRAYTRLARRYHPGINPGDRAAGAVFERIAEAYETLSDPERRQQYDAAGSAPRSEPLPAERFEFTGFDFTFAARGNDAATFSELFAEVLHPPAPADRGAPEHGADLHTTVTVTFEESIRGTERQVVVTRHVTCGACAGAGQVRAAEGGCPECQATGRVRWARGHMVFTKSCGTCGGSGRQRHHRCNVCAGHGRSVRAEAIAVRVPPGVIDGARLRVPERGHGGSHGGRLGDLYVDVHVQPHPRLQRRGDDLVMTLPIAVHEAVLGATIDVPSIDGEVRLRVRPGTHGGEQCRVAGRGAPTPSGARGDLIVELRLVLPATVDERSRELMREFGERNKDDVRRDLRP
jgi:molecular chaperone DnaJ